jgi:hypothetical protein
MLRRRLGWKGLWREFERETIFCEPCLVEWRGFIRASQFVVVGHLNLQK